MRFRQSVTVLLHHVVPKTQIHKSGVSSDLSLRLFPAEKQEAMRSGARLEHLIRAHSHLGAFAIKPPG